MTWNVSCKGKREEVQQKVNENESVPTAVKKAIADTMEGFSGDRDFTVVSIGHHSKTSFNHSLEVSAVEAKPATQDVQGG